MYRDAQVILEDQHAIPGYKLGQMKISLHYPPMIMTSSIPRDLFPQRLYFFFPGINLPLCIFLLDVDVFCPIIEISFFFYLKSNLDAQALT